MVSIFAETVYDETSTVTFANDDNLIVEIPAQVSFPTVDVSSIVGDFTYIETAIIEFNFVGGMDIEMGVGDVNFGLDAKPTAEFNGNLDVFSTVQSDRIVNINNNNGPDNITAENFSGSIAIDSYVDTPLDIGYDFSVSGVTTQYAPRANGAQTIDMQGKIGLVGRQP